MYASCYIRALIEALPSMSKPYSKSNLDACMPMHEMWQFASILLQLIPSFATYFQLDEENISERQLRWYIEDALGEAPQPEWGLPNGIGSYLAKLFSWATGKDVTQEQATRCAQRMPGRSWVIVDAELASLGKNQRISSHQTCRF